MTTRSTNTQIVERVTKNEQQSKYLGERVTSLEKEQRVCKTQISKQSTELKLHKADLDNKFEKSIMHFESLERSIISLKDVVDNVVPVLNNMIAKKVGTEQAKAKMAKIFLGVVTVTGTGVGVVLAFVKLAQ